MFHQAQRLSLDPWPLGREILSLYIIYCSGIFLEMGMCIANSRTVVRHLQRIDGIIEWANTAEVFEKGKKIIQILLKDDFVVKR